MSARNLQGALDAVRLVRADDPGRPPLRPADGIKAGSDAAAVVGDQPAIRVERYPRDGTRPIADRRYDEVGVDDLLAAGADGAIALDTGPLHPHPFHPVCPEDGARRGEKAEMQPAAAVAAAIAGEIPKQGEQPILPAPHPRRLRGVGSVGEVGRIDEGDRLGEAGGLAQLGGGEFGVARTAPSQQPRRR